MISSPSHLLQYIPFGFDVPPPANPVIVAAPVSPVVVAAPADPVVVVAPAAPVAPVVPVAAAAAPVIMTMDSHFEAFEEEFIVY